MTIGVAVIGAGFWGRNQIRVLSKLSKCNLIAACDIDRTALQKVKTEFQIEVYTEIEELLTRDDVDAVTLCTPTTSHFSVAQKIIKSKKHVLIEKPLTSTITEAKRLINLAQKMDVYLSVGFIERFNPAVRYLKNLIDHKKMGKIILITARRVTRWPQRIGDIGVTKDSAIHDIDVMRFILNSEISHVYANVGSLRHQHEDFSEIMVKFHNGVAGFIDANWLTPKKIRKLVVTGSEATTLVDYLTQELTIEESLKSTRPRIPWEEPLQLELDNFIKRISEGKVPSPTAVDGLKALEICEAALQSSKKEKVVKI